MGRQIGTMIAVSVATAMIASAADPGDAQAWVYLLAAALLIAAMPLIPRVLEHHGAW